MSKYVTLGCSCYFYMEEGWVLETLVYYRKVFLDDILIYSQMMEDRDEVLRLVLQCCKRKNYGKYVTMLSRIHCLGHVISDEGIDVDPMKVEDIRECPVLTNVPEVCSFMGLAGYY